MLIPKQKNSLSKYLIYLKIFQVENRFTIRCNSLSTNSEIDLLDKSGK